MHLTKTYKKMKQSIDKQSIFSLKLNIIIELTLFIILTIVFRLGGLQTKSIFVY